MTSWVPSHVELTIHQARDLLLKTKNSNSAVYVSVIADREKCQSQHLPPSTAPLWQFTSRIPLMSLDTTILCFVRQKTSLKDKFLGLVSIPLSTFTISSKPVTHWYKLGAKAGKTSSKLRGELLLSIKFLSNWVAEERETVDFTFGSEGEEAENKKNGKLKATRSVKFSSSPFGGRRKSMLKRTKSEAKPRSSSSDAGAGSTTRETDGKGDKGAKKEKSKFRLSIKKKSRSPVLEECSDEFMSLSLPGKTESPLRSLSPPAHLQSLLQRGGGDVFEQRTGDSEYLSRSLDRKHLSNGHRVGGEGRGGKEGEGAAEGEDIENQPPAEEKMSPALRYHNFKRKKRPWSMHTVLSSPQSERSEEPSPSTTPISQPPPGGSEESPHQRSEEVVTYRAKSSLPRGVANGGRRYGRSNSTVTDGNNQESGTTLATPTRSPLPGGWGDRSSGLGNVALSSTLPARVRQRSQSVGGATWTPPTPRRLAGGGGGRSGKEGSGESAGGGSTTSSSQQSPTAQMKSMGMGPRVPLATSLGDSPHRRSGGRGSPIHLVSEDHSPRTSPLAPRTIGAGMTHPRNPSPIHLQSTLVEEEEEEEEEEGDPRSPARQQQQKQQVETTVKSRVPIETESSAFQVDASELEVVLEATTPRRRSIVAVPQSPVRHSSSSASGSPLGSPVKNRKLPVTPGSTSESDSAKDSSPVSTPSPQKPTGTLSPATTQQQRAHSTSPIVVKNRSSGVGEPCLSGRSSSTMALSGGGVAQEEVVEGEDRVDGAATLPRGSTAGSRHTVSYREKPTTQDYQPLPALPPSLMQSLQHTQLARRQSEPYGAHSTLPGRPTSTQQPGSRAPSQGHPFVPQHVQGLHNIRTFDPRLFGLLQQSGEQQRRQSQPTVSVTNPSFDETDSAATTTTNSSGRHSPPVPNQTRSVTPDYLHSPTKSLTTASPSHKLSQTYPGTPLPSGQERGVGGGGGGGGKKGGGLQAVVSRYQENRRRSSKGSPSRRTSGDFSHVRLTSAELGGPPTSSSSAGSSPVLQRRASTHLGHSPSRTSEAASAWRNPFSNLRRTQSHKAPPTDPGRRRQQLEIVNSSRLQGPARSSVESLGISSTSSSPGHDAAPPRHPLTNTTEQLVRHLELEGGTTTTTTATAAARNTNSNNEQCGSQIAATPTSLPSDTDSLRTFGSERTLVEGGGSGTDITTAAIAAAAAAAAGGGQTRQQNLFLSLPSGSRHKQTCSSVDSEGLGSLASEEIEEAGPVDWSQWSKEELVRELVQTKSRLRSTEEELKAVRGYLDNLLLRIMETSPGILSVGTP